MPLPDPRSLTAARIKRTEKYALKIQKMFSETVNELLALPLTMPEEGSGEMYSFDSETEKIQKEVEQLMRRLHASATLAVQKGVRLEWDEANKACDAIVRSQFSGKALESEMMKGWNGRNLDAMRQFINRSDHGMNLSKRIWQATRQLRDEMEVALTVSIGEGEDAGTISRRIRQYLNDPDLMFRRFRYKDKDGNWQKKWKKRVKDPDNPGRYKFIDYDRDSFRPGRGYYKSSAQNAMRVARTETNIAYRRADHERWQGLDFVLGQRVVLSKSHPCEDICDRLSAPNKPEYDADDKRGVYPKDFVFDGWHPQCFCFVIPIMVDKDEMKRMNEAFVKGEEYTPRGEQVTEYPEEFQKWVRENADKIHEAQGRGTEPYFVRNNAEAVEGIINADDKKQEQEKPQEQKPLSIAERAKIRHDARTPEREAEIREQWQLSRIAAAQQDIDINWKSEWDNIRKKAVGKTYADKLLNYIDAIDALSNGNAYPLKDDTFKTLHYISTIRDNLQRNMYTTSEIKHLITLAKPRLNLLGDRIDTAIAMNMAKTTDASAMPASWRKDFLGCIRGLGKSGIINIQADDEKKRLLDYSANITKLLQNKHAIEYGLERLSTKTPVEIFERFVSKDKTLAAAIPDKKFFDGLSHFVSLEKTNGTAYCTNGWPPVVGLADNERYKSISGLSHVLHHEYGHAYDRLSDEDISKIWRHSNTELRKEYDALKGIITKDWRTNAKNILDEAYAKAGESSLPQSRIDEINRDIDKKKADYRSQFHNGSIRYNKFIQLIEELGIEKDKSLGIYEPKRRLEEIKIMLSDIVEAIDPAHNSLGYGGHGYKYWNTKNNDLAEFIAECSEVRHLDYGILQKAAPEIYALMLKYGKIFWP